MTLPVTIKHPHTFLQSPAYGFDGVFDWSWTVGCFGGTITPMDFDGIVERKGNFIIFETKNVGVPIPKGQLYTFESAYKLGVFTLLFIEGKNCPESAKVWCAPGFKSGAIMDSCRPTSADRMAKFCREWYEYADKNPAKPIDVSFLNKKIVSLENALTHVKEQLENTVKSLGGFVQWP
jgi:hypothetical protein